MLGTQPHKSKEQNKIAPEKRPRQQEIQQRRKTRVKMTMSTLVQATISLLVSVSDSEVDHDSSQGDESSHASGSSTSSGQESNDSEPAMSEVSDQCSMLEHAYQSVRDAFLTVEGKLIGGDFLQCAWKQTNLLTSCSRMKSGLRFGARERFFLLYAAWVEARESVKTT